MTLFKKSYFPILLAAVFGSMIFVPTDADAAGAEFLSQFGAGQIVFPFEIAFSNSGNLYVSDSGNGRIAIFDSSERFKGSFGTQGIGKGQFDGPRSIAFDSSGNIYVVEQDNNRVQKFNSKGNYLSGFGKEGTVEGLFRGPYGIALDSSRNIYVVDSVNHRVQIFDSSERFKGSFGTQGIGKGQFNYPKSIAFDSSGKIYVTDSNNSKVHIFDSKGKYFSEFGKVGTGKGEFFGPSGIAFDSSGNIYVVDSGNQRVQIFDSNNKFLSEFGSLCSISRGTGCVDPDGAGPLQLGDGQFLYPYGIALDSFGNIYVADTSNNRIQKFSPYGVSVTTAPPVITSPQNGATITTSTLSLAGTSDVKGYIKLYNNGAFLAKIFTGLNNNWSTELSLTDGVYTITATVGDAGDTSDPSVPVTITIDALSPPVITSPIDGVTITTDTITIRGTSDANNTIDIRADGFHLADDIPVDINGNWEYTTPTFPPGDHVFIAIKWVNSNTYISSAPVNFTVARVPPTPVIYYQLDGATFATNTITLTGTADPNNIIGIYESDQGIARVTADANGNWEFTSITLPDSSYRFTADAITTGPARSALSAPVNITVDTSLNLSPPVITEPLDGVTINDLDWVKGTLDRGDDTDDALVYFYDNGDFKGIIYTSNRPGSWDWGFGASSLPDGVHSFTAIAHYGGHYQKISAASTPVTITIDSNLSNIPLITSPTNGETIVAQDDFTLTGTADANTRITVFDNGRSIGTPLANENRYWTLGPLTPSEGVHSYTATASDGITPSSTVTVTIGTFSPPVITETIIDIDTVTLRGTAESNEEDNFIKVYDDGTHLGNISIRVDDSWIFTTGILPDGEHSFTAKVSNGISTSSESNVATVTIDTSAPSPPVITSPRDNQTITANPVTFTGTADVFSIIKVYDGSDLLGTTSSNSNGDWELPITLSNGEHSFTATASDTRTTSEPSNAVTVTIDTSLSTPVITSPRDNQTITANPVTFTGTADAFSIIKVYDRGDLLGNTTTNSNGDWELSITLPAGFQRIHVTASDDRGTSDKSETVRITLDIPPSIPVISSPTNGLAITTNPAILRGTADADNTIKVFDNAASLGNAIVDGNGDWIFTTLTLPYGAHTFTATANNSVNTSDLSAPVTISILTFLSPPVITSPIDCAAITANPVTLRGTAGANNTIKVYDRSELLGTTTANSNGNWTLTATLSAGEHSFTATANDGKSTSSAVTITFGTIPSHTFLSTFGTNGIGQGQFSYPEDITVDSSCNIYAADTGNHRVQIFDSSGKFLSTFGGYKDPLYYPEGIALDSSGNIYVAHSYDYAVQKFDSRGNLLSEFEEIGGAERLVFGSSGNIYAADTGNNKIQIFNPSRNLLSEFGEYGSGNDQFNDPLGIALDSSGNIYVVDTGNDRVQKFTSSGVYISQFGTEGTGNTQFNEPTGIALDSLGNIYVADSYNYRVQIFDSTGTFLSTFGEYGDGNGQFTSVEDVTLDSSGNIYVAAGEKIQKFSPFVTDSDGIVDTDGDGIADDVDACPTEAGVGSDGCPVPIDTDGDGIADDVDSCPTEAGVGSDGCPVPIDTDGDGIADDVDSCPTVAGVAPDGCPRPSTFTEWTQTVIDLRNSKPQSFQISFPIGTDAEINRVLAWAGNPVAQANNPELDRFAHMYSPMKSWNERSDLQAGFPTANLAENMVDLIIWAGQANVLANPFNADLVPHEPTYVLLRYFFLERDDLRNNTVYAGALDASDPSRLYCFAANSGDTRLTPHKTFYENNCVATQTPSTTMSFGGTLESAKTFTIMESDGMTSTYGKQGYTYGFKAVGVGLSEINSDKICGLSLCSETMNPAEKIQLYLDQLFSEQSSTQRSFGGVLDFDSSTSVIPSSDTKVDYSKDHKDSKFDDYREEKYHPDEHEKDDLLHDPVIGEIPDFDLYVSNNGSNEILVYDGNTGAFLDVFVSSPELEEPTGLTFGISCNDDLQVDLYVSSFGTDQVLCFDGATGAFLDVVIDRENTGGDNDNTLRGPHDLIFGRDGNLYVATNISDNVIKYDMTTQTKSLFIPGSVGKNSPYSLNNPDGLAFGPDENNDDKPDLYVNNRAADQVLVFDGQTGIYIDEILNNNSYPELDRPTGLINGSNGALFISNSNKSNVLVYQMMYPTGIYGDFVQTGLGGLQSPHGLVLGPPPNDWSLYVSSKSTDEIMRYSSATGNLLQVLSSGPLHDPMGLTFGPNYN